MRSSRAVLLGIGLFLLSLVASPPVHAQQWGTVEGTVTEAGDGAPIPGVTVVVNGTDYGTATTADGAYELRVPAGRYALRFSSVGYSTRVDSVVVRDDATTRLDVTLQSRVLEMEGVTVEGDREAQDAGVYEVDPEDIQNIPTPFKDGFRALKTVPGVATNNELSQQYSVRGGGYNENLVFIEGFEVFMPFRPRQGEQEGLGLLNPTMASGLTFYTGGFPARYGGKLSSALDVTYAQPQDQALNGSANLSTLDAGLQAQSSALDGRLGWNVGVRRAQPGRFFGTQDLKGDYNPQFTDAQALVTYRFSDRVHLEGLGIHADHTFELDPQERKTYFGIISLNPDVESQFQALWSDLNGARTDGYVTNFGGLRLHTDPSDRLRIEHHGAFFGTKETENFDIQADATVQQVDPAGDPDSGEGHTPLSRSTNRSFADNRVRVERLTGGGRYQYLLDRQALEGGWHVRSLHFDDRLNERSIIRPDNPRPDEPERIVVDSLNASATFNERQVGAYLQNAVDVLPTRDRLIVTGGVRTDYFSFNDEWTISPRLTARYRHSERLTLTGSWGVYHQKPTYRELRGTPTAGQTIDDALNRSLQSQRSIQYVLGGEYFLPSRRLYLRAEAYYKDLSNVISYRIDDIRVEYSGENDAEGYIYGLDLQLRGEFVPGLESWFNYSYMVAREEFTDDALSDLRPDARQRRDGLLPRPTDQRHTFSAFIQDYVPGDKTWKLHMRMLYGSGLPYTPPVPGEETVSGTTTREPGPRMSARLPAYRRVDLGATKVITVADRSFARGTDVTLNLTLEVLNLFDMDNTVDYSWQGDWTRVPKRLTPRTLNARARLTF
jgi:hypothetical protein